MSLVERKYNESLDKMSGMQRVERSISLFSSFREMLKIKICEEFKGISGSHLQIKIAERLYISEKNILELIKKAAEE